MQEGLQGLLPDIAACMAAPDADVQFLNRLQMVVLAKVKHMGSQGSPQGPGQAGGAGPAAGGPPGAGVPGQGLPGGPPGGGAANGQMRTQGAPQAPVGGPGGMQGGVTPPMVSDDLRRELAGAAGE
jgi:hypothetical protein